MSKSDLPSGEQLSLPFDVVPNERSCFHGEDGGDDDWQIAGAPDAAERSRALDPRKSSTGKPLE